MTVTIQGKEYLLRLLCGKFRALKEKTKSENLMESIMDASGNSDVDFMAKALSVLCVSPYLKEEEAYQVLDEYLGGGHTVMEFGNLLLEVLDESGFLPKRGMAQEIARQMDKAMDSVVSQISKVADNLEAPPFGGFKA